MQTRSRSRASSSLVMRTWKKGFDQNCDTDELKFAGIRRKTKETSWEEIEGEWFYIMVGWKKTSIVFCVRV